MVPVEMPKLVRNCRCVTLHTYPAAISTDSWDMVMHICHCGREHFMEPVPEIVPKKKARRPSRSRAKQR